MTAVGSSPHAGTGRGATPPREGRLGRARARPRLVAGLLLAWLVGRVDSVVWAQGPETRAILTAIVQQIVGQDRSTPLLIAERTAVTAPLPIRPLPACGSPEATKHPSLPCGPSQLDSLPGGLLTRLNDRDTAAQVWRKDDLPAGAELLPDTTRAALLAEGPRGFWPAFGARFPGASLVTLSRFQVAEDGLAVGGTVMVRCGSLCGYVVYAILERREPTAPWRVTRWITALRF